MADTFDVNKKKVNTLKTKYTPNPFDHHEEYTNRKLKENTSTPLAGTTVDDVQVSDDPKRRKQESDDINSSSEYSSSEGQDEYTSPSVVIGTGHVQDMSKKFSNARDIGTLKSRDVRFGISITTDSNLMNHSSLESP